MVVSNNLLLDFSYLGGAMSNKSNLSKQFNTTSEEVHLVLRRIKQQTKPSKTGQYNFVGSSFGLETNQTIDFLPSGLSIIPTMAGQLYTLRNVHSQGLLDYGNKRKQQQSIIAMAEDIIELDEAALEKAQVLGNLDLEKVMLVAEYKIAKRDAAIKARWLPADLATLPPLPVPLGEVLKSPNMVKTAASKFLCWLFPGQKLGERYVAAWLHKVDTALFVHTSDLMPGIMNTNEFCMQDIINFKQLRHMKSLSNGIISEVKKESKVKSWTSVLKILLEWRGVVTESEEPAQKTKENEKEKRKKRVVEDSEEDFVEKTPPKKFKLLERKRAVEKRQPKDTSKAKEYAKKRINENKSKNRKIEKERKDGNEKVDLEVSLPLEKEREVEKSMSKSDSDMFADSDESSSEEYYNRRPSGRVASRTTSLTPPPSFTPPPTSSLTPHPAPTCSLAAVDASCSSSDYSSNSEEEKEEEEEEEEEEEMELRTSTPTASRRPPSTSASISCISPLAKVAKVPKKPVVLKHLTVTKNPDKQIQNKAEDMTMECEKLLPKNRNMKLARYELDRNLLSETETDTDEDEEEKVLKKDVEKTKMKPGEVAEALRKNENIKTPVNLQLEKVKIKKEETTAKLSDTRYQYEFVISKKIAFMLDPNLKDNIKMNTIVTITEVKKTKEGKKIIKDWMIKKRLQVNKKLGKPVAWE